MALTLIEAVEEVCHEGAGVDGQEAGFNTCLAEIQDILGQKFGDEAAMFFDDEAIKKWNEGNLLARKEIISEYITYELRHIHT